MGKSPPYATREERLSLPSCRVSSKLRSTGLPSSVCVLDCDINGGFIGDQISLSKDDGLGF